jgi:hypothetical protein
MIVAKGGLVADYRRISRPLDSMKLSRRLYDPRPASPPRPIRQARAAKYAF